MAAREDRAKRRQERRAGAGQDARAHDRGRSAPEETRVDAAPTGQPVESPRRSNFVRESADELKKVEWPGQAQVIQATTVVLIACVIVGAWLYFNDFVWQRVVKDFLLK